MILVCGAACRSLASVSHGRERLVYWKRTHTDLPDLVDFDRSFIKLVLVYQVAGQYFIQPSPENSSLTWTEHVVWTDCVPFISYELHTVLWIIHMFWLGWENAPSELIRDPNALLASKWTDKNLFEASFVKLAVFFLPSHLPLSPFTWKDVWFGVSAVVWFAVTVGLVVNGPWQSLYCIRCYHVERPDGVLLNVVCVCA